MALLVKSVLHYSRLTTQAKHLIVPQLKAAFSVPTCSSRTISSTMIKYGIVPDVIPEAPSEELEVVYPSGAIVSLGNELTPTLVKDEPKLSWSANQKYFYTVCMTDPDAPCLLQPTLREWHHWLVVNIPGNNTKKGEVLSEYIGSGPPKDSGIHRYVFLVYKQPSFLTFDEPRLTNRSVEKREKFSIKRFANKYDLKNPVAGNFFRAEYDDYVPLLYKQLSAA